MTTALHVVLDASVITAAATGHPLASRLLHRAHAENGWHLYVSACALVEADRNCPGSIRNLTALPGITVLDLDLPAALTLAGATTWAHAHTQHSALPCTDRPDGAIVATVTPRLWETAPVRVLDLSA
ncbi:hypothetical protein ACIGHB_29780 [Streptomyces sp. NPDC085460]|uniref:hypothetical protein n=1 Tax=Streptomyces sp. NPDC085460 TaxID=3365723 RepID=UPI0037CDE04C